MRVGRVMGYMVHLNDQVKGPATPRAGQGQVVIMATTIDKDTPQFLRSETKRVLGPCLPFPVWPNRIKLTPDRRCIGKSDRVRSLSAFSSMSQPNNSTTSLRDDDEYEFPDELEGIDWSAVGPIEGDEPKPETPAEEQTQSAPDDPPPPTELPPRPGSSSSSYGFTDIETLDEDDLAELDETERLYGLATGE